MDVTIHDYTYNWTIKKAVHEEFMLLNCGVGENS